MLKKLASLALLLQAPLLTAPLHAMPLSEPATEIARYALAVYPQQLTASLAGMVRYNTVADPAVPFDKNPQHLGFKKFLGEEAARLGFDFEDHGHVLVIGHGDSSDRVGIITHGDVQPVNPAKWAKSPFELDATSEPGRLIARGAEDDKGPIATALYAMKAIKDSALPLKKRLELYVYMAEESDWGPLEEFLKTHLPPQMNITLDSEYPVVTAEKGWGAVTVTMPAMAAPAAGKEPVLTEFAGGFFGSQIPEDASAVIGNATRALEAQIRQRAARQKGMRYDYAWQGRELKVTALGLSAHSSKPEDGVNAISMLADALKVRPWTGTPAASMVRFLNDLVGTGLYGERFGKVAYRDAFMGRMTVAPTVLKQKVGAIELNINLRRPRGKPAAELKEQFQQAFGQWKRLHAPQARMALEIGEPWVQTDAPQVPVLLDVFEHYTGARGARPISIGGGTNSRLFPKAVSFGPAMPGMPYTGHSEHEYITNAQLLLNLQMYTAVLVELAR
ncbi:dipeptidase [Pseudoduganella namucuonensis]|uniref:Dipeptidase D n=1 Tax=Pseudoduganella namucuonensis TaxID=1035707 RepID=A0A1I7I9S8_9BURK|nr:dipeptidase [Pseudoduganella namucuonensis]SFU69668.1 dipeptidase D [Pseudoduganella namucuonensis]